MGSYNIDTLETKIYAIYEDLTYKEIDSIERGFKTKSKPYCVVVKRNIGITKSFFNDDYFAQSQYEFYTSKSAHTSINISGWKLLKVNEPRSRNREVYFVISDTEGEIRNISNLDLNKQDWSEYYQIDGICKILKLIRELSKYPNWTYYDLMTENKLLRSQIEEILSENRRLKEKIENKKDE